MKVHQIVTKTYTVELNASEMYKLRKILVERTNGAGAYAAFAQTLSEEISKSLQPCSPFEADPD